MSCVVCHLLDRLQGKKIRQGRLKAKRGQNKQIQRMVKHSNERIRLAEAGENALIPIPTLDRRSPFDPQNLRNSKCHKSLACHNKTVVQ